MNAAKLLYELEWMLIDFRLPLAYPRSSWSFSGGIQDYVVLMLFQVVLLNLIVLASKLFSCDAENNKRVNVRENPENKSKLFLERGIWERHKRQRNESMRKTQKTMKWKPSDIFKVLAFLKKSWCLEKKLNWKKVWEGD